MATNQILQVHGTQLLFADHATDFGAAPATSANSIIIGTPTEVQIDLTGVAAGSARQSAKTADLGSAWAQEWMLAACIEFETAPAAAGTVAFYWAASPSATAGTGNGGGVTGTDAPFTVGTEDQLQYIGQMTLRNNVINIDTEIGILAPSYRYGSLIIINNGSTAFRSSATAMDETHVGIIPLIPDIQAAA